MLDFNFYKQFLNVPYKIGVHDCYGLVRKIYLSAFGIDMPNYARPDGFSESDLNLVALILNNPNFVQKTCNPARLRIGDVLFFRCGTATTNHFGIYIGNNMFVHHRINSVVKEENLDQRWIRRLTNVAYHKDIVLPKQKFDLSNFMPQHLIKNPMEIIDE